MCIKIICSLVSDVTNFEIKRSFLIKPFFYITENSWQKNINIPITKKAFEMKEKKALLLYKHRLQEFPNG